MRITHVFILSLSVLALASCATNRDAKQQSPQAKQSKQQAAQQKAKAARPPMSLERMDTNFLYIAAQQAEANHQPALAARFLKALVKKEPRDITPRFELVDILLATGQKKYAKSAKTYMQDTPQDVVEHLEADDLVAYQQLYARSLIANGETEQAAMLLHELLQNQPDRIDVRLLLVRLYAANKKYADAHQVLQTGLKRSPDLRLQDMQVKLYVQEGRLKEADKTLARMQMAYPDHEEVVLQRAHLAEKQGQGIKAESLLQLFIDTHPKTAAQSYSMLAGIYVRQNRLDAAIITYERMLPITGNDASVLMSLGKLYYQQQKFSQAADYFKQAVAQLSGQNHQGLNDEQATAHFYYGASLEASHQWQNAVPQYQMLQSEHDLYLDAQLRLASIDINQKHFDDAEIRLLKLQTSFKDNLAVYEMLSGLRLQQKQYQDVISESDKAVDLGYSQVLLFNRAVAFEKLQTYKQLDAALDTILGREPNNAETLNFYGYSLADRGVRLKDAQSMVEKALSIRPDDGYYLDSLAWVFFKKKEYDKALKLQLDAVKVIKNDPVMMEHLGDIYWQNKEENQAKTSWQRAVDLGHGKPEQVKLKIKRGLL